MADPENIKIDCQSNKPLHIGRLVPREWLQHSTPGTYIILLVDEELIVLRLKGSVRTYHYMACHSNGHQIINPPILSSALRH